MEYCYHDYHLDMLKKIKKQVNWATGSTFADSQSLQKIIAMWSVLVSSIDTLLEVSHMVSIPRKVCEDYFLDKETNLFGQIYGGRVFYMGRLMITSCKGMGNFTNAFSGDLNTTNLNIFPKHSKISKVLSLRVIVMRFHMLCHVQFPSC